MSSFHFFSFLTYNDIRGEKMKIFDFQQLSLKIIEKDLIIIYNYQNLIDYTNSLIIVDYYKITGDNLIIEKIDELRIEIKGKVNAIEIVSL